MKKLSLGDLLVFLKGHYSRRRNEVKEERNINVEKGERKEMEKTESRL